jgi:hypothetical protein
MTPKEEAKEIIDKFLNIEFEYTKNLLPIASLEKAKQCALICVQSKIDDYQSWSDLNSIVHINGQNLSIIDLIEKQEQIKHQIQKL